MLFLGLELLEQRVEPAFVQVVHAAGIGRAGEKVEGRRQVALKLGRPTAEYIQRSKPRKELRQREPVFQN